MNGETGVVALALAVVTLLTELLRRFAERHGEQKKTAQAAKDKHERAWKNGDIPRILYDDLD